jgi:hypothetical protein
METETRWCICVLPGHRVGGDYRTRLALTLDWWCRLGRWTHTLVIFRTLQAKYLSLCPTCFCVYHPKALRTRLLRGGTPRGNNCPS